MTQKLRVVLYLDASCWAANSNTWFASSQPSSFVPGQSNRRYQIVIEIPDPRGPDEIVRGEVTDVTEEGPR